MAACTYDVESIEPEHHVVQFYESDEDALVSNVGRYLLGGLERSESLLVVAGDVHRVAFTGFLQQTGVDVQALQSDGTLEFVDAEQALNRFLVGGYPDGLRFEATIGAAVRAARSRSRRGLRAYGEMVGLLWSRGQYPAAIRLEQLWHQLMAATPFTLFCSYQIDVFDAGFNPGAVQGLLCGHTHLLPSGTSGDLGAALDRGMREVLGPDVSLVQKRARQISRRGWASLPNAEATILWLRKHMPDVAPEILSKARTHYRTANAAGP